MAISALTVGVVLSPGGVAAADSPPSGLADASSAATEADALAIAEQFGHAVVADSDTTETELVSAEPDGSFELTESSQPVRVLQAGSWVPVDTDLVSVGGMWVPQASAAPVRFSAGGSGALAQVQAPDGSWLSESWPAGSLPAPSVSGSTATYAGVFPGVDLQLVATATGMSSVLVVHTAAAASDPQLASVVGPGASLDNLLPSQTSRIQAVADRLGRPVSVVGSRAAGTAGETSDWDYIIEGSTARMRSTARYLLPRNPGQSTDILNTTLDPSAPSITFYPGGG